MEINVNIFLLTIMLSITHGQVHPMFMMHGNPANIGKISWQMWAHGRLNIFAQTTRLSGWLTYLGVVKNMTVFAPEDSVFDLLSVSTKQMLSSDMHRLYQLTGNHFHFHTNFYFDELEDMQKIRTGNEKGSELLVNVEKDKAGRNRKVWVNGLLIKDSIRASNGVIHTLTGLITTPTLQLIEFLQHYYNYFGSFEQLLQRASIKYPRSFTIFVPANACFRKKRKDWVRNIAHDGVRLLDLVKYHIIPYHFYKDPLPEGRISMTTLSGKVLDVFRNSDGDVYLEVPGKRTFDPFQMTKIVQSDLKVRSGIIHVIDNILEPYEDQMIMEKLGEYKTFTRFVSYLLRSGVSSTLLHPSKRWTVFAPPNHAFSSLPREQQLRLEQNMTYLQETMRNHIREGKFSVQEMGDYTQIRTLHQEKMMMRIYGIKGEEVYNINEVVITLPDKIVKNGLINFVDGVLLPKEHTLYTLLKREGNSRSGRYGLQIFNMFMRRNKLQGIADRDEFYKKMIWAPSDEAFKKLSRRQFKYMMKNKRVAREILRFHFTPGYFLTEYMTADWIYAFRTLFLPEKLRCRRLSKEDVVSVINPGGRNAEFVSRDVTARNGLYHVIDEVLIPKKYARTFKRLK